MARLKKKGERKGRVSKRMAEVFKTALQVDKEKRKEKRKNARDTRRQMKEEGTTAFQSYKPLPEPIEKLVVSIRARHGKKVINARESTEKELLRLEIVLDILKAGLPYKLFMNDKEVVKLHKKAVPIVEKMLKKEQEAVDV